MAWLSFFFHCSATSFARGSSGLGALNNAWIDSNTVRICRAGDHLSGRREVQKKMGKKKKTKITAQKVKFARQKELQGDTALVLVRQKGQAEKLSSNHHG